MSQQEEQEPIPSFYRKEGPNMFDNWCDFIGEELGYMGMLDIWVHEGLGFSNEYVKKSVKLRLDDMFKQQWQEDVNNHDYCDHYKIIKNQWGIESYLTKLSFANNLTCASNKKNLFCKSCQARST